MKPLIKLKTTTLLVIPLVLACFALLPRAQAVSPAPDGAYTGFNTAEGLNALLNLATGQFGGQLNTALGFAALKADFSGSHNTAVGAQALLNNDGSYNTAIGENALVHNITGNFNMALGQGVLASNTFGTQNTAMGFQALNANNADANVATGYQALFNNTSGIGNVANGYQALFSNTDASGNVANGFTALFNNTTGSGNVANGVDALFTNTTGTGNTANGRLALLNNLTGNNNTANGNVALSSNINGSNNTANGFSALFSNTTGFSNTADGVNALLNNHGGSNNIALGVNAGLNLTTGSNNIDVGNVGVAGESGIIRIGSVQTRTFIAGIRGRATGVVNAIPVLIDSSGQLGTASSSQRFKKEIKPMDKTSEAILALKPVTFHYKTDSTGTPQFGLIAEEVAKINPDLVVRDADGEIYSVRYEAVNAMLLNEFLKEHRQVQDLKTIVAEQQKQIEALTAGLEKVNNRLELIKPAPQMVGNNR